jgi:hypothetical protein
VAEARAEAAARPIPYALGSGEADEVALYAGIKPLIRQVLAPAALASARTRFEALGLVVEEAAHRVALPSTEGVVIFVGRDRARVREAQACEAEPDHDRDLGRLLGYPRCCVEAYLAIPPPRSNAAVFVASARATAEGAFAARLNTLDLAIFHYVSWLPCSFGCAPSKAFADAVADHIAKRHGQFLGAPGRRGARAVCPPGCRHERFVGAIDEALSAHRLMVLEDVQVSIDGVFDGREVRVARAWPTARDRHPEAGLGVDAQEAAARLAALVGEAGAVAVEDGVLYAGGAAVLRSEEALLAPFVRRVL